MQFPIIITLALFMGSHAYPKPSPRAQEDALLTTPELVRKYGYPAEEHQVTTPDGYILTIHRIPHGKDSETVPNKVVFLQHGLLTSSADWVLTGTEHGLAYLLADAGYDVWMGNGRGNRYSRNHTTLNPDTDAEFWHFSWHEIGAIDIPAVIDHILEQTGQENLYYVGHSQGTTTYFVMTTTRPEYNEKIKAQFSLAPIAYMGNMISPLLRILAFWSGPIDALLELIGWNEFTPHFDLYADIGDLICGDGDLGEEICTNFLFILCGFNESEMNATLLPVFIGQNPAGSSTRQLMHYAQEINSGYFRQYDFVENNTEIYGSADPPSYDLSLITAPSYLFYSKNDWMAAEVDVERLCEEMGDGCAQKILIEEDTFNHLDYILGIRTPELVYNKVIRLMAELD